jgi:hypothetical protein
MREKSTLTSILTEQEYEEASRHFDTLADALSEIEETHNLKERQDLKLLSQEVIQFLRRLI